MKSQSSCIRYLGSKRLAKKGKNEKREEKRKSSDLIFDISYRSNKSIPTERYDKLVSLKNIESWISQMQRRSV